MSKIIKINKFDLNLHVECDCGEIFEWYESSKYPEKIKDVCPKCKQIYGLVIAPQKLDVIPKP